MRVKIGVAGGMTGNESEVGVEGQRSREGGVAIRRDVPAGRIGLCDWD